MLFFSAQIFADQQLLRVDVQDRANTATLLLQLDKSMAYRYFTLSNPDRLVIDLEKTALRARIALKTKPGALVRQVRYGFPSRGVLRLVFELREPVKAVVSVVNHTGTARFHYAFMLSKKNALVLKPNVNFKNNNAQSDSRSAATLEERVRVRGIQKSLTLKKNGKDKRTQPSSVKKGVPQRMRDVVIVIDPGHGGKDPGAIGPHRTQEKHVTLAIARALKNAINRQPGLRAVLTRDSDHFIGLRERLKIARRHDADLFVSIHADAYINSHSTGVSVFALSERGATSEAARWLAEKENYSELGGVNLKALQDTSGMVRTVLIDLSQTATISSSLKIGGHVLGHLSHMTKLHKRHVEQARFMVLKSPDIPSILVETGYISNPEEERNLTRSAYQQKLAMSIAQGISTFFFDNPPHGTWIETRAVKQQLYRTNKQAVSSIVTHARLALNQHHSTIL